MNSPYRSFIEKRFRQAIQYGIALQSPDKSHLFFGEIIHRRTAREGRVQPQLERTVLQKVSPVGEVARSGEIRTPRRQERVEG